MRRSAFPRRTFLHGLGLSMGLPLLDIMSSGRGLAAAPLARAPVRMAFVFVPNGMNMQHWTPTETGPNWELSQTLQPLTDLQSDLNVISGLAQDNGRDKGDGPGDHARAASTYLTGAHPFKTEGADIRVGVSVDQAAAEKIGSATKLPSLELGTEKGRHAGGCDSGYSCAYSSAVSWKSPSTPMAKECNPRLAFERLFGSGQQSAEERKRRDFYRKSILDIVASDATRLKKQLGRSDQQKLDEYFTSVRELEQRILRAEQRAPNGAQPASPQSDIPTGIPSDAGEHIRLMYDVMALAFRTDATRIATFMVADAGSNRSFPMLNINEGHHELSHHGDDASKLSKLQQIDQFHVEQFAYFLQQLKSVAEGDRTLLDNSMIVYGSGLADGNAHNHADLPIVLAGRGGNTIQTGRHIRFDHETPLNNLFLSLLDRAGAPVDKLGDSTGRLSELAGS